jgi:hypothetical protein
MKDVLHLVGSAHSQIKRSKQHIIIQELSERTLTVLGLHVKKNCLRDIQENLEQHIYDGKRTSL